MEDLTLAISFDVFNYFISFRLFTHLGVNKIQATHVLNKNKLRKCTIIGDKHLQKKRGTWSLWTSYIKQASSVGVTLTVVGWNNSSAICIASSESCEPKRFVRCRNKVEIYIQEQQPNQLHCYKQNMGFVNRMDQHVTKYWYPNEKIVVFPACLNGVCLLFRVNGYCVVLTKIKTMNLASSSFSKTCCQCNFSEIFKGRQIVLEPFRNSKYLIRCLLWWHKTLPGAIWTQAYSGPLQISKRECFCVKS